MKDLFYYLDSIKDQDILSRKEEISKKIENLFPDQLIDDDIAFGLFVLHFPSFTYLYTSDQEKAFGVDFTEKPIVSLNEYFSKFHPLDQRVFKEHLDPYLMNLLQKIPPSDLVNWVFTYDFRILTNENTTTKTFVNRNIFVMNDYKEIIFSFGKIVEISSFAAGKAGKITLNAMQWTKDGVKEKNIVFSLDKGIVLTKREKQILSFIKNGYSSKKIADKLYLSIHTVNKHRKNMLHKSGLRNSAELISYAINNGLIY